MAKRNKLALMSSAVSMAAVSSFLVLHFMVGFLLGFLVVVLILTGKHEWNMKWKKFFKYFFPAGMRRPPADGG